MHILDTPHDGHLMRPPVKALIGQKIENPVSITNMQYIIPKAPIFNIKSVLFIRTFIYLNH